LFGHFQNVEGFDLIKNNYFWLINSSVINSEIEMEDIEPLIEYYESFVIVNFIPTSEQLSKWIFNVVQSLLGDNKRFLKSVEWKETRKSNCEYGE
jgi:hypothetical protein